MDNNYRNMNDTNNTNSTNNTNNNTNNVNFTMSGNPYNPDESQRAAQTILWVKCAVCARIVSAPSY